MDLSDWRIHGREFTYRGHRVFYRRAGAGAPLLLIHGFPTASWDWHRVWDALVARFDVVAPDMLGFGFSDKPHPYDYSIRDQATLHERLLGELAIDSVHLVAHDYGTSVAQELLARHAERTEREEAGVRILSGCLLNGGIIPGTHRPLRIQRLLMGPLGPLLAVFLSERTLRRSLCRIFGPRTQPTPREIHDFWTLIEHGGGRRVVPRILQYMREREASVERWVGILRATRVPLRLINGLADPISGAHVVEAYRRLVDRPDVVGLEGIGHYPQVEAPDAVLGALLPWLESVRQPG